MNWIFIFLVFDTFHNTSNMADEFDVEAMLEAPYRNEVLFRQLLFIFQCKWSSIYVLIAFKKLLMMALIT